MSILPRHIVFATTGSLGDLHPFLALGCELKRRGHQATIATSVRHAASIRRAGLGFCPMRPDPEESAAFHARYMHPRTGGEFVYRHYLAPAIQDSYEDLLAATRNADLLVSQSLMALAAPLVAASTGIPWMSAVLQPMSFFSRHERPNYLPLQCLSWACGKYPEVHARVFHAVRQRTLDWVKPVLELRDKLGIVQPGHPMFEGQHSPVEVLAMFSPLLGVPQPDWPAHAVQTGAALYLEEGRATQPELQDFIHGDTRPFAVFTLSSAASNDAGSFYRDSLAAAKALRLRALLVTGGLSAAAELPDPLPEWALRTSYASFEGVFPHAAVIVHSGGVATSFKALQAGKPQLIVPHAHDQRDNAMRLVRLGVASMIGRRASAWSLRRALQSVWTDAGMAAKACAVAETARNEDGVQAGCDRIERFLQAASDAHRSGVRHA